MTTIDLGEAQLQSVDLQLEKRVTLGAGVAGEAGAPGVLPERIALGRPQCRKLDLETVDSDARPFLEARVDSAFWLLGLTCSFLALEDEPLQKAWLQIQLEADPTDDGVTPLAWSMEPLSLSDPVQVGRTATLDATLKLSSGLVPIEVGPSASRGITKEYTQKEPYVEAHSEGTARPSWIFSRTPVTEIRGVHHLRTVVEMPAQCAARAKVSVGATVMLKLLGLVPYRSNLDRLPDQQVVTFGP